MLLTKPKGKGQQSEMNYTDGFATSMQPFSFKHAEDDDISTMSQKQVNANMRKTPGFNQAKGSMLDILNSEKVTGNASELEKLEKIVKRESEGPYEQIFQKANFHQISETLNK